MDPEDMPKVDLTKDAGKLTSSDRFFIKKVGKFNVDRVSRLQKTNRNGYIIGGILATIVVSIYSYTIFAVKQERFLDDFEIPQTTTKHKQ